jgi:hypothetical protein
MRPALVVATSLVLAAHASAQQPAQQPDPQPAQRAGVVDTGPQRVLVLDAAAVGVDDNLARQVTAWIAEALQGRPAMKVLTSEDLREISDLESSKALLGCENDASCLAELTAATDADLVVSSSVGKVGTEEIVSLALLESERSLMRERVSAPLGPLEAGGERVAELVGQLFGWGAGGARAKFKLAEGEAASFAVFDLVAAGVSNDVVTNLTQILSAEIKRVDGASVIGRDDIRAMLAMEADKSLVGCDDSVECLAEIGGALGVDRMIVGHVGRISGQYVISLRLIAIRGATVENRISETFRGPEEQLLLAIRHAGRNLLGLPSLEKGIIAVSSPEASAVVTVDGEERGPLPLKPVGDLAAGRHNVRVVKPGFLEWNGDVYVNPGETTSLWVELERAPAEWYESWVFWTSVAGVGAVAVAAGVGAGVLLFNEVNRPHPLTLQVGLPDRTASGAVE